MPWYNVDIGKANNWSSCREQFFRDLQNLYKKYLAGELGPPKENSVPECKSTFCDDFESNWHTLNKYVSQFNETFDKPWYQLYPFTNSVYEEEFEQQWFIDNNYINEYEDEFTRGWFTFNNYVSQWVEDFEDGDWNE